MKVLYEHVESIHSDERRNIYVFFKNDFNVSQIKLMDIKSNSILGGHYHDYTEGFYMINGLCEYTLIDIKSKEKKTMILNTGDKLIISAGIAHKSHFTSDSTIIEYSEIPYISSSVNDHRWVEW